MGRAEGASKPESSKQQKVVVALDASRSSLAALRAAAELAAMLDVDLEGLFVEDADLTILCRYPLQQEVGSYTGVVRRLDNRALQRQLRAMSGTIRRAMEEEARRRTIRWTFNVRRGSVLDELLTASRDASVMSIGRASRRRRALGSTARAILSRSMRPVLVLGEAGRLTLPLTVLCTGNADRLSADSERALQFAVSLQRNKQGALRVLAVSSIREQGAEALRQSITTFASQTDVEITVQPVNADELRSVAASEAGTLILPRTYAELLADRDGAAIVVP